MSDLPQPNLPPPVRVNSFTLEAPTFAQQLKNSALTALMTAGMLTVSSKYYNPVPIPPAPLPSPAPIPGPPNPAPPEPPAPKPPEPPPKPPEPIPGPPSPPPVPLPTTPLAQAVIGAWQRDGGTKADAVSRGAMLRGVADAISIDAGDAKPRLTTVLDVATLFRNSMKLRGFNSQVSPNTTNVLIAELSKVIQGPLDSSKRLQLVAIFMESGDALMIYGSNP